MSYKDIKEEPHDEVCTEDTHIGAVSVKSEGEINSHLTNLELSLNVDEFYETVKQSPDRSRNNDSHGGRVETNSIKRTPCKYTTKSRHNLVVHSKGNRTSKPTNLDKFKCLKRKISVVDQSSLARHIVDHHRSSKCPHCAYVGKGKSDVRQHVQVDHAPKKFKCLHCDFVGKDRSGVRQHINVDHSAEKFKCSYCEYETMLLNKLYLHEFTNHNPKFKCAQCKFMGSDRTDLNKHFDSAHGPVRLKCPHCDFVGDKSIINGHIKVRHKLNILLNLSSAVSERKSIDMATKDEV